MGGLAKLTEMCENSFETIPNLISICGKNSFEAIQNFPALVFTISRGDAADSSYNQSDYGSFV